MFWSFSQKAKSVKNSAADVSKEVEMFGKLVKWEESEWTLSAGDETTTLLEFMVSNII
jgi:hypothetical protein